MNDLVKDTTHFRVAFHTNADPKSRYVEQCLDGRRQPRKFETAEKAVSFVTENFSGPFKYDVMMVTETARVVSSHEVFKKGSREELVHELLLVIAEGECIDQPTDALGHMNRSANLLTNLKQILSKEPKNV